MGVVCNRIRFYIDTIDIRLEIFNIAHHYIYPGPTHNRQRIVGVARCGSTVISGS